MDLQPPPIFIVGNKRSGTTMFRLMLSSHKDICVPPEGGFVVKLAWKYGHLRQFTPRTVGFFVEDLFKTPTIEDWEFNREALLQRLQRIPDATFPRLIDSIYREYIERKQPGKLGWGDKTTWYQDYLPLLDSHFPTAKFVHVIRDGRAVLASFKQVEHLPHDPIEVALEWVWGLATIQRFGQAIGPSRYYEVKYEHLVENPEVELRKVCNFLEKPYCSDMLKFAEFNRKIKLEPERHLAWKSLTLQDVTTSQVSKWQTELNNEELATFWDLAGEMMARLEYDSCDTDVDSGKLVKLIERSWMYRVKRTAITQLRPRKAYLEALLIPKWEHLS
jgi:Sulfotransferase family